MAPQIPRSLSLMPRRIEDGIKGSSNFEEPFLDAKRMA